uniref:Uncharacterized protein n=1 Tax=Anguilla anguilla TaxID=7936 RepID=A0A0E9QWE0_ANGAN
MCMPSLWLSMFSKPDPLYHGKAKESAITKVVTS